LDVVVVQNLDVVVQNLHVARVSAVRVGKEVILDERLNAGDLKNRCCESLLAVFRSRVARFFLKQYTQTGEKIPNCH
jgi:hypothetical protein